MTRPVTSVRDDEAGSVIIMVLVLSVLLMGTVTVVLGNSNFEGDLSTQYNNTSQASLAAQSGLAVELTAMRQATVYTSLPCGSFSGSLSATGATSSFSGSIAYYPSGSTTALTCSGSTLGGSTVPATATIVSTGTDTHGSPVSFDENVAIATTTTPAAALGYALFSENAVDLTGAATVDNSTGYTANLYSGGTLTCANGTAVQGAVTSYTAISMTGSCAVAGITDSSSITLGNSATINGNVTSYGGSIAMSGSAKVNGSATETSGTISIKGSGDVTGNASASGAISCGSSGTSPCVPTYIGGAETQNDSALSSQTMPGAVSFPTLDPAVAVWQAAGWTVVQIPNSTYTCAQYFQSNSSGAADPFQSAIDTETTKTVYYAPTCAPSYTRTQTFEMGADTVLQVQSYTTANSDTYESTTSTSHDFSILASAGSACSTANTDVTVSNQSDFTSTIDAFIYSPGEVSYANAPSMTGQILACGGITGSNSFTLTFNSSAATEIPGSSSVTPPTVSVTNKYVS